MTSDESGVEVIPDEGSVCRSMDLSALAADAVQERLQAVVDDLVELRVVQRGAQAAGEALRTAGVLAAGQPGDAAQRGLDLLDGEADGARELGVEQQEVGDPPRVHAGGEAARIGLERRA